MERFGNIRQVLEASGATRQPRTPEPWQLAPRVALDPRCLVRDENDRMGHFFLSLSLGFNDLKGVVLLEQYLLLHPRPDARDWSAYAGQWRGLQMQILRWVTSVLHEIMNVVRTEGVGVTDTPEFAALLATVPEDYQRSWQRLASVATSDRRNTANEARLLYGIRNHAGFHYLAQHLAPAFADYFVNDAASEPSDGNQQAMFSNGNTMSETRFYYADAVVQRLMRSIVADNNAQPDDVIHLAGEVNNALAALIFAFLHSRQNG